jgi:hypothetical protein
MMTDARPRSDGIRPILGELARHPVMLWAGFVVVHFWLGMLGLYGPGLPLGDVTLVYRFWVENGLEADIWVGIDTAWVYPILAIVPMLIAYTFGPDFYASTWLSLVMVVDAAAFAVLTAFGRDPRVARVGWWWLGFLVLLGPVALGSIDAITVPIAIMGMLALGASPRLAAVLLTVAAWIKVWPAALVAAVVVAIRARWTVALTAIITSAAIGIGTLLLGAGTNILSFVAQQTGRGLQIESPIGMFWMWDAYATSGSRSLVYYDQAILTFQVVGPGSLVAATIMTPALAIATGLLLLVGLLGVRRGVPASDLLPPLALAITTALILFNKVGSPQFVTWLAVPVIFGLTASLTGSGRSFRVPVVLSLVIAGLTQTIYPYLYAQLLQRQPDITLLLVLSARNVLYVVLFSWALWAIVQAIRRGPAQP